MSNSRGASSAGGGRTKAEARLPGTGKGAPGGRPRPAATHRPPPRGRSTPRRVRLTLSRVDPWSVMKIAFLLSVALAIACVVMTAVLWTVLSGMGVFDALNGMVRSLDKEGSTFQLMDYLGFGRVVSLSILIGVIDMVIMTAVATLMAFLYNICASLVGGLQLTLSDE